MRGNGMVSGGLLKNYLRRFWPLCLAYFVVLALLFVVPVFSAISEMSASQRGYGAMSAEAVADWTRSLWTAMRTEGLACTLVASAIAAVAMGEHLFDMRAATFVGSLPVRRTTVFATNYLAGLALLLLAPAAAVLCLLPLCVSAPDVFVLAQAAKWYAFVAVLTFVFFSLAQLVCQLTGTRPVAILLYGVTNVLAVCLEVAVRLLEHRLLYGFGDMGLKLDWLSPAVGIMLHGVRGWSDGSLDPQWGVLAGYAVAAVAFVLVAGWLFTRRNLEAAGTSIVHARMATVLKYLAGVSMALLFATVFYVLTANGFSQMPPLDAPGTVLLVLLLAVGAFVGVLFAQMIMDRSTRVWAKVWRGGLCLAVICAAVVGACRLDVLGLVRYVPRPEEVQEVELSCDSFAGVVTFASNEGIAEVCDLQRDIVASQDGAGSDARGDDYFEVRIYYRLTSGRQVLRSYAVATNFFDNLNNGTPADAGTELVNRVAELQSSAEGRASRYGRVLEANTDELRYSLGYYNDDYEYFEQRIPARECADLIERGLRPDLMEGDAGDVLHVFGSDESEAEHFVWIYVMDKNGQMVLSQQLNDLDAPHTFAWIQEHYPRIMSE